MTEDGRQNGGNGPQCSASEINPENNPTSTRVRSNADTGVDELSTPAGPNNTFNWTHFILLSATIVVAMLFFTFLGSLLLTSPGPSNERVALVFSLVFVLSIVAIVSLATSFWLYYVRTMYLKEGPALVPEKWGQLIQNLEKQSHSSEESLTNRLELLNQKQDFVGKKVEESLQAFLSLRDALDRRDAEIERLQKGHDSINFRKFLIRFVKVFLELEAVLKDKASNDNTYVLIMFEDALEECGLERFKPSLELDYRDAGGSVDEQIRRVPAPNPESDYRIAEVDREGFVLKGQDYEEVLLPARVAVFVPSKQESVEKDDG